jgi:hypothetical protein
MSDLNAARERTDAKLRYADVHITELKLIRRDGSDFDAAHQESFLFHLFGVRDALLQEINIFHSCGLAIEKVTRRQLENVFTNTGLTSPALDALIELEDDPNSWLSGAAEMRHQSTHRRSVPRTYYKGGADDGAVHLHDTRIGQEIKVDYVKRKDDGSQQWLNRRTA